MRLNWKKNNEGVDSEACENGDPNNIGKMFYV